jgi:leucyl aminopeptidase
VTIVSNDAAVRQSVERARLVAEGQNFARTIASRPGNVINPPSLAKVAQQLAKEVGLQVRVLDEKEMTRLGMGGILAVGQGSANPPRMIVLEHRAGRGSGKGKAKASDPKPETRSVGPAQRDNPKPVLVVGKSITFDTGGISIKSADKMGDMIFDKCGGMAVLGLMYAAAKLKLPVHLVGILTSAENMPSSTAYRPGDILRMYNGVTVEVTNTDAEGRLVLGDALAWGIETYKPAAVVDLATLTGGCVVALGFTMAGVMSNSDLLMGELQKAADMAGEKIWRLPVGDDQREQIKSGPADIVNSAGRWASPLQGGAFLSHFIPRDDSVPWAHFDIAGVADTEKELPYYARGATGWGVRTLVEWVTARITTVDHATPRAAGG